MDEATGDGPVVSAVFGLNAETVVGAEAAVEGNARRCASSERNGIIGSSISASAAAASRKVDDVRVEASVPVRESPTGIDAGFP
jgi:hypothetical protein